MNSAAKNISKKSKSSFYYALRLLPKARMKAMMTFYAFCRVTDDIVDQPGIESKLRAENLDAWESEFTKSLEGKSGNGLLNELSMVIRDYCIDTECIYDLIKGMRMDLEQDSYQSLDDLILYCYRVASTVGLVSAKIFGYRDPSTKDYAIFLGIALQLTNILRDIGEDIERGRVYIPAELMKQQGCGINDIKAGNYTDNFCHLASAMASLADEYYLKAENKLSLNDRFSMYPAMAMARIYHEILNKIRRENFRVLDRKINIPQWRKAAMSAMIFFKYGLRRPSS